MSNSRCLVGDVGKMVHAVQIGNRREFLIPLGQSDGGAGQGQGRELHRAVMFGGEKRPGRDQREVASQRIFCRNWR